MQFQCFKLIKNVSNKYIFVTKWTLISIFVHPTSSHFGFFEIFFINLIKSFFMFGFKLSCKEARNCGFLRVLRK